MAKKRVTDDGEIVDDVGEINAASPVARPADEMLQSEYTPFWKTPWNHDTTREALATATGQFEQTLTQQSHKDDADINTIMRRFGITSPSQMPPMPPSFATVNLPIEASDALRMIREGEEAFMQQPAEIRSKFGNDLGKYMGFVDHCIQTNDKKALQALNLVEPDAPPAPQPPPVPPVTG